MNELVNVRAHGATGDGANDDTEAIRKAIGTLPERGGVLYFPPGQYVSDTIRLPAYTTVKGDAAWSYFDPGAAVLSPARDDQKSMIDIDCVRGCRVAGLALDGMKRGECIHGISAAKPRKNAGNFTNNLAVDDCWIQNFSGSGVYLDNCHVWAIRHNLIRQNGIDGIDAHSAYDAWIIDNQIGMNGRYGIYAMASITITANRIEQNEQAGVHFFDLYVEDVQVNANHFCSERGPAIELAGRDSPDTIIQGVTITGNMIRNSGSGMGNEPERNCHIRLENAKGVACTGNSLHIMWGPRAQMPAYGIIIRNLTDSVVANNAMHHAAHTELIRDLGGHENTAIERNPGSLKALCPPE